MATSVEKSTYADWVRTPPSFTLLDGAMGSELTRRGGDTRLPLWSARALVDDPELVFEIHRDYVAAGADVITTNTFRTKRRTIQRAGGGRDWRDLTRSAVDLARRASKTSERSVRVAGSISPLEDCYSPSLSPGAASFDEHLEMARELADAGCDIILVETMATRAEAVAAARAARETGNEYWVSLIVASPDTLYSGEELEPTIKALLEHGPGAILVNCSPPTATTGALAAIAKATPGLPRGAYPNAGVEDAEVGWRSDPAFTPAMLKALATDWLSKGATIVGGCCGTNPAHIRAVARLRGTT